MAPMVLLVDDEQEYVLTLSERMQLRGYETDVAHSGEEALSYVVQHAPDVMVLDLNMPGMTGIEVLQHVKHSNNAIEVIILTGHGNEKDEQMARALGAFDYLQKPTSIDALTRTVSAALAHRRNR